MSTMEKKTIASIFQGRETSYMPISDFLVDLCLHKRVCSPADGRRLIRYGEEQGWLKTESWRQDDIQDLVYCRFNYNKFDIPPGFNPEIGF